MKRAAIACAGEEFSSSKPGEKVVSQCRGRKRLEMTITAVLPPNGGLLKATNERYHRYSYSLNKGDMQVDCSKPLRNLENSQKTNCLKEAREVPWRALMCVLARPTLGVNQAVPPQGGTTDK